MLFSLRTLFFSVPALIVLIGGYYVAPKDPAMEEAQSGSSFVPSIEWPSEREQDLLRRVAIKQETVVDLLDGHLTVDEAIDRFRLISTETEPDASESDLRYVQQVLSFARSQAARDPLRYREALTKIESSLRLRESSQPAPAELIPSV